MKIKYWLMISYLIVMLLPIAALYFLYISISTYEGKKEILEYMEFQTKLDEMEPFLSKNSLYQVQDLKNYDFLKELTDETMQITLYRADGLELYSSLENIESSLYEYSNLDLLYKHLDDIQKSYRTYSIKKPVFEDRKLIGIYQVSFGRDEWVQGVNNRTVMFTVLSVSFFILLYSTILLLLNRKLNRPLLLLRKNMTAFANGEVVNDSIAHSKDEIGELISHFEKMKEQIEQTGNELEKQHKEKEFIVAALSHDLKTPLTVIGAYTEALLKEPNYLSRSERNEYENVLSEKLDYMKQLLDDLAMYTALQSSNLNVERVKVDGEEFFDMLLSGYDGACKEKGLILTVQIQAASSYFVNVKDMIRIVDNLMANAIRHTNANHNIWLAVISAENPLPDWVFPPFYNELGEWKQNGTLILVQNEGESIPVSQQELVFNPFFQVEGARGQGGSSGLGLSITKMLMEQHNGKIKLWSTEPYGTLIACWLEERKVH